MATDDSTTGPASAPGAEPIPAPKQSALFDELGAMVNQNGGVSGMVQQFEQKGLGGLMSGFVSNGANPPISGEQIVDAVGKDQITALAGRVGLSEAQVASGLTMLLPTLIHELTPNGTVPAHDPGEFSSALSLLKSKLF